MQDIIKIKLKGLDCPHCAEKITTDVKKLQVLQNPEINLIKQELSAIKTQNCFEDSLLSQITEIVHKYEPDVEVFIEKKSFKIALKGLDCAHCAGEIEEGTNALPQVKKASVNLLKQEMEVIAEQEASLSDLLQRITEITHRHEPDVQVFILSEKEEQKIKEVEPSEFEKGFQKTILRFGTGLVFFLGGVFLKINVLFLISYFLFGYDVLWRAIKNIKKGQIFDENFLMSISTIGAIFLGELAE